MGVIAKQSIKGSLWSYIGIIIGFFTTTILYPQFLSTELVGLFGIISSYSAIFSQFSMLGIPGMTAIMFVNFRDKETTHHGFSFLLFLGMIVCSILFIIFFYFYHPYMNEGKDLLFANNSYLLIPTTIFAIVFSLFDNYNKMLYNIVLGVILQEVFQRILLFVLIILFAIKAININQTIIFYAAILCIKGLIIFIYLLVKGEIKFTFDWRFINKKLVKLMLSTALFSVISGMGISVATNIDKIIMNDLMDLSNTGVYTIAFYFGTLVIIPARVIVKIAGTIIADAWKNNDVDIIRKTYYQSCINQLIIGAFIFAGIWVNINNIIAILGNDYEQSKWAIFFVGLAYVIDMLSGISSSIVSTSKYYKIEALIIFIRVVILIICLYSFIPIWGIVGAAISVAISILTSNIFRHFFLYKKYNMQPLNRMHIFVLIFFTIMITIINLIPQQNLIIDIIIKSGLVIASTFLFIWYAPAASEMKIIIKQITNKIITK